MVPVNPRTRPRSLNGTMTQPLTVTKSPRVHKANPRIRNSQTFRNLILTMSTRTYSLIAVNGPFVIGYTLCFGFMGVLAVQAYIYFTRFADDRIAIKTLVIVVLLLETLMTGFVFSGFWASATLQNYSTIAPATAVSSFMALAPITGVVTTLTHGFYCWRISILRRFRLIILPIMMVSLLQLASITYLARTDDLFPSIEDLTSHSSRTLNPWLVTWLGSSVVCDLAITLCMILSLRPSESRFASNKSTLVKLTRLTIETGLVTTVAALIELILGTVYSQYLCHVAVFYAISKLYANCLLASLNFRLVLRSQSDSSLTAIVWDDMKPLTHSRQLGSQSTHVAQILPQVDIDLAIDLNKIESGKTSSVGDRMDFVLAGASR